MSALPETTVTAQTFFEHPKVTGAVTFGILWYVQ